MNACLYATLVLAAAEPAGQLDVTITRSGQELIIDNPWPPVTPTIYIVGQPDRTSKPVRKTKGVTLAGVRLSETCLSESVLILYPGGAGKWGYHLGADIFRLPDKVDPRTLVEYDKLSYDPLEPVTVVGSDMNLLRLYQAGRSRPAVYELAFPEGVRIRRIELTTNVSGFEAGSRLDLECFADRALTQRVAGAAATFEKPPWSPLAVEGLDRSRLYVRLSAQGPAKGHVDLYYTKLEADLDTAGLALPELKSGRNVWTCTDDADSSHRARIVVRWHRQPDPGRIWEDFEGDRAPFDQVKLIGPRQGRSDAFTGQQFGRIEFVHEGKDFQAYKGLAQALDLSKFNRLSLAVRTPTAGLGPVLFGLRNADTGNQYVRLGPDRRWKLLDFDISRFKRDRVQSMTIYFLQHLSNAKPGTKLVLDVDTICFYQAEEPPPAAPAPLPRLVLEHRSPYEKQTPPARAIPPVQEWFPLGVYAGYPDPKAWPFMLDDLKQHHMNTIYVSNGSLEHLEAILPMAEARGIRLIHQGGGAGSLYFLHYDNPEARRHMYEHELAPQARRWIPRFRDRWGLVAWSLTEEIGPDLAKALADYYALVRQLDPSHPPTVLHNNPQAAEVDLKQNRPAVITHDFYPYFWSPMSGPSNPPRSLAAYRSHVQTYYRICRQHGASLWMMPQAFGHQPAPSLDPPLYGYRTGMRTPEPGEVKLQGWLALAEGATGLMYYHYRSDDPEVTALRTVDWQPTPLLKALGELFAQVLRVAPLLCRLERDYKEGGFVQVESGDAAATTFVKRKGYDGTSRYIVIASLDGFKRQDVRVSLQTREPVYDMLRRQALPSTRITLDLGPGEGTLLAVGTADAFQADCRLIDAEQAKWK